MRRHRFASLVALTALALVGCITIRTTNVDTTAIAYMADKNQEFHNGEDFIEVTVGAADSVDATNAAGVDQPVKAVYHLSLGLDEAQRALTEIGNQLAAEPTTKIVVVALGDGIGFLLNAAKDNSGNPFAAAVQALKAKGVEFRACKATLTARKIDPAKLIPEATLVASGMAELARLQAKEGYAYLRP